ncbi:MAG: hemolysin family protein [Anaerovoracaceae bacterium]|nr:hemolysin family protein [Anaerovoracaceae bacterium]
MNERKEIIMAPRWFSKHKNDVEEEVMSILEESQGNGEIREEGKKMINAIFAFDDKLAHEIMTPRTDVFMIDIQDPIDEFIEDLMRLQYSRIPVCDGDSDNIIGILHVKDYMIKAYQDGFENVDIRSILRKAYFVPETKKIDTLFFELQKTKQHIAILIDEYGGFAGIVTMEDIIEEVMGDIDDEYDEEETEIVKVDENTYMIDGNTDLDDINDELGLELVSENSETLGGFIIELLGDLPDEEEKEDKVIEYENLVFKIESVKDRRIEKVKLYITPESSNGSEE